MLKTITIAAAIAALSTGALMPQAAQARDGGAVAAGIIGGVAAGAIIGSQVNRGGYDDRPRYRARARDCYIERRDYEDRYGRLRVRNVRVCD